MVNQCFIFLYSSPALTKKATRRKQAIPIHCRPICRLYAAVKGHR